LIDGTINAEDLESKPAFTKDDESLVRRILEASNHHKVLGCCSGPGNWRKPCNQGAIRNAYLVLSPKVNPDKNKAPGSLDAMQKVNEAYGILSGKRSQ